MGDQAETLRKIFEQKNKTEVISILSGKGGVGKSIISVNLGIALADLNKKVTVIDADFGLANVNVLTGILPKYTLLHFFKKNIPLSQILVEVDNNFYILPGASGVIELTSLSPKQKEMFINALTSLDHNNYYILDIGAGISKNVIDIALASDRIIIVTTPEPTAIADAYGVIKALSSKLETDDKLKNEDLSNLKFSLILNRVKSIIEAKRLAERIITTANQFLGLNIEYLGFLFEDKLVSKSVIEQEPFVRFHPYSKPSLCIKNMAKKIAGVSSKNSSISNFFKKLFNK